MKGIERTDGLSFGNIMGRCAIVLLVASCAALGTVDSFCAAPSLFSAPPRSTSSTTANSKATTATTAIAALGALEVDATSEVVANGYGPREEDGPPPSPPAWTAPFLREAGAIAVPRGVAPGCLTETGDPIVVVVAEDRRPSWMTAVWNATLPHRRTDLVWVITTTTATTNNGTDSNSSSSSNGAQQQRLSDQQRTGTVVMIPPTTDGDDRGQKQPAFVYGKHASALQTSLLSHHQGIGTVSEVKSWTDIRELVGGAQTTSGGTENNEDDTRPDHRVVAIPIPTVGLVCTGESTRRNTGGGVPDETNVVRSAIVVGGGILGSSIARALSHPRDGLLRGEVTLCDPTREGIATPASWAWLNANQKPPQAYKSLNQMGLRAWRSDPVLSSLPSLRWGGTLVRTKEPMDLNGGGYAAEGPLDAARIRELEPEANFTTTTETNDGGGEGFVYYFADEGHVDPREAVRALRKEAVENGVSVVSEEHVVGLVRRDGRVVGVKTSSSREHLADVVVVAAGANSSALAGVPLVHSPSRTYFGGPSSFNDAYSPVLKRTLVDMVSSLYLAQRPDGTVVAGGGSIKFGLSRTSKKLSAEEERQQLAMAQEVAQQLAPDPVSASPLTHKKEVVSKPMPKDGFPILGFVEPGLYSAVTHSGMTLSPLLGQLVAAELKGQVSLSILDEYRPTRFTDEEIERDPIQDWQERESTASKL